MRRRADPHPRPATTLRLSVNRPHHGGAGHTIFARAASTLTFPLTALIHPSAWKRRSPKFISRILHSLGTLEPEDGLFSGPWLIVRHKMLEQ
jgi:hypothetical protein